MFAPFSLALDRHIVQCAVGCSWCSWVQLGAVYSVHEFVWSGRIGGNGLSRFNGLTGCKRGAKGLVRGWGDVGAAVSRSQQKPEPDFHPLELVFAPTNRQPCLRTLFPILSFHTPIHPPLTPAHQAIQISSHCLPCLVWLLPVSASTCTNTNKHLI